jgi:hypothetical protein
MIDFEFVKQKLTVMEIKYPVYQPSLNGNEKIM